MNIMPNKLAVLALFTLFAHDCAMAATPTLTASLHNVNLQVFDLTPADGIAAAYRIDQQATSFGNRIAQHGELPDVQDQGNVVTGQPFSSALEHATFSTNVSSLGGFGNADVGMVWDAAAPFPGVSIYAESDFSYKAQLTLAPGSALVLSGTARQTFISAGMGTQGAAYTAVWAYMRETGTSDGASSLFSSVHRYQRYYSLEDFDVLSDFTVTYTNSGATDLALTLEFSLMNDLSGYGALPATVSAVPEPSTYAMLGAGIAVLAGMGRRRKRSA